MENKETTINANYSECIKAQNNWSNTVYHNVCTGESYTVQTGVYDYLIGVPVMLIVMFIALSVIAAFFRIVFS